ncbi:MAG: hypothetical protein ACRCSN_09545 [Dermatophilaceae bacterium]
MTSTSELDSFADGPLDDVDAAVAEALRAMLDALDPVPVGLAGRAQFAMTVAALEADVARIVQPETSGIVRAADYDRASSITFASDGLSVMVAIEQTGAETATVRGWLTAPAEVEVRERSRTRSVTTDDRGRFTVEGVARGLVHFVIRPADPHARPVITPTFEI